MHAVCSKPARLPGPACQRRDRTYWPQTNLSVAALHSRLISPQETERGPAMYTGDRPLTRTQPTMNGGQTNTGINFSLRRHRNFFQPPKRLAAPVNAASHLLGMRVVMRSDEARPKSASYVRDITSSSDEIRIRRHEGFLRAANGLSRASAGCAIGNAADLQRTGLEIIRCQAVKVLHRRSSRYLH